MYTIPEKLKTLTPYSPDDGDYTIRLDANESFVKLPEYMLKNIQDEIEKLSFNRYPDPICSDTLKAFADYYEVDCNNLTAGNGSDELISLIINCFLDREDKIAILQNDFSMYNFYAHLAQAEVILIPKNSDFTIDINEVVERVNNSGAKMLIFSNPCNPTSLCLPREDIKKIIRSVNALVILDEAYMDFYNQSLIKEASEFSNLILLRTCSKMIGLASVRLGFAVANKCFTDILRMIKSPYNVNAVTALVAKTVMSDKKLINELANKICRSRDYLYTEIKKLESENFKVLKSCTNFVMILTNRSDEIYEKLREKGILIRLFENALRITAGTDNENKTVVSALKGCL